MFSLFYSDNSDHECLPIDSIIPLTKDVGTQTKDQEINNNVRSSSTNSSASVQCKKKTKKQLTKEQEEFKKQFFAILTHRKKLRKEIVKKIHNEFLVNNIEGLAIMTRDESRSINLYFINRIDYQDKIFKVLKEHKDKISEKYLRY